MEDVMKQETKDFLLQTGYRMWKEKVDSIGVVQNYQKRVDSQYPNAPLCSSNEKLFINITYYSYHLPRSEEHTSELQSRPHLVCRLLLEKKKKKTNKQHK